MKCKRSKNIEIILIKNKLRIRFSKIKSYFDKNKKEEAEHFININQKKANKKGSKTASIFLRKSK